MWREETAVLSSFDYTKLNNLLKDFYELTGIRITVFDENFRELTSYPKDIAEACAFIRQNPEAEEACHECDRRACEKARNLRKTFVYQCHAELTEAVAPVYVGNLPAAYILFGHLFSCPTYGEGWEKIRTACARDHLDEKQLKLLIDSMPVTPREKILASSHILSAVASYLFFDRIITLRQQDLSVRVDEYISEHYLEDLDVRKICSHFYIGKTQLYQIAAENYGKGIAEHIRDMKIARAEELLADDPDLSVHEISSQCGFSDYNYFITVFKKQTGTTPGKYRKNQGVTESEQMSSLQH